MRDVHEMRNARHAWHACFIRWNVWNIIWNDMKCNMKWCEMPHEITCDMRAMTCNADRLFRLHATRCNLEFWFWLHTMRCNLDFWSLIVDCDHNLIILFLISLRIRSIGVDVKLTQQDVKNPRLQIVPPYHPFCKGAKQNDWERRAKMKWSERTDKCMVRS